MTATPGGSTAWRQGDERGVGMSDRAAEIANVEMAAAWDGEEGDDWTEHADRYEATGRYLVPHLERAQQLRPTDVVLDIGCGTGASTVAAARVATQGRVLGVDLSSRMLAHAAERARTEGLTNIEFRRADAQVHPFEPAAYTLATSEFGTMFFNDPEAAFANIRRALAPEGRLAMAVWRRFEENEWLRSLLGALDAGRGLPLPGPGQPGPFGLAERDRVEEVLAAAGWRAVTLEPVDERMWLGTDPDDAWSFVSGLGIVRGLTADLDDDARRTALGDLRRVVDEAATPEGVVLGCAAWLVTASA